jgi:hypothetical protein
MRTLCLLLFASCSCLAGPIVITTGGTWGTLTGSDAYFASNEAWTLSFEITPAPGEPSGVQYVATYSDAVYTLNGVPVALTGNTVFFYTFQSIGFCLDNCTNDLVTSGGSPQLFTGSTSNPVFTPGNYATTSSGFSAYDAGTLGDTGTIGNINIAAVQSAPEPAVWTLTGAGLLFAGCLRRRKR